MNGVERFARLMLNYPVLWDPLDFNYRDNTIKARVREELLVQINRISRVHITLADLKRKIRSFCSNRRRKINRWEDGIITDPSQCKLIQQQHSMLSHAYHCMTCELSAQANGEIWECALPHCRSTKGLMNHMASCQAGDLCTVPDCKTSKNVFNHWKQCRKDICSLCSPQKTWQRARTTIERNHIVDIMLQSISSNIISPVIIDQLAYVKRKERDVFKTANTRSEYYRVLADMMWQYEMGQSVKQGLRGGSKRSVRV